MRPPGSAVDRVGASGSVGFRGVAQKPLQSPRGGFPLLLQLLGVFRNSAMMPTWDGRVKYAAPRIRGRLKNGGEKSGERKKFKGENSRADKFS